MKRRQQIEIFTSVHIELEYYFESGGVYFRNRFNMLPGALMYFKEVVLDPGYPFTIKALEDNGIISIDGEDFLTKLHPNKNVAVSFDSLMLMDKTTGLFIPPAKIVPFKPLVDNGVIKDYVDGALYSARFEYPCEHVWIIIQGFTNTYEDCKHCGIKKEDLSNTYVLDLK